MRGVQRVLPLVVEIHKRTATGPLMRRPAQGHKIEKSTVPVLFSSFINQRHSQNTILYKLPVDKPARSVI